MTFLNPFEPGKVKQAVITAFVLGVLAFGALMFAAALAEPELCCPCKCQ